MLQQTTNKLNQILESRRLVSVMNQTKWRELAAAMAELKHLDPLVRLKYVSEDAPTTFAPIWWDQLEENGFEWIEWLEVQPTAETQIGLLVPVLQTDYADLLQEVLERYSIAYEEVGNAYRITGYTLLN